MKLVSYKEENFKNAYGASYFNELSPSHSHGVSFYPSFCKLKAGDSTIAHSHYETEVFLIKKGEAIAHVNGRRVSLKVNDQLIVHPFENHVIENSGEDDLEFYSIYNQDNKQVSSSSSLIISAPPTPNGRLHLGHLSGPYLSADVLRRFKNLKGENVAHFSGTDDHQSYTYKLAEDLGFKHEDIITKFRNLIEEDLKKSSIEIEKFSYPSKDESYQNYVRKGFKKLISSVAVKKVLVDMPFDKDFKFEAYLKGECPSCHTETTGQCCEKCGFVGMAHEFSSEETKKRETYVLHLEIYRDQLKKYHENLNLEGEIYQRARKWRENLGQFSLTVPSKLGIDNIHVWCEMAFGLLLQRENFNEEIDELVYCFGIDNAYYYLILLPTIFFALGDEDKLPERVIINKFYDLEGEKFSTSRNHALWVKDFHKNEWDYLRFYLALTRSENEKGNFSKENYMLFSDELALKFQQIEKLDKGKVEHIDLSSVDNQNFYQKLVRRLMNAEKSMELNFSLNNYANEVRHLINDFLIYIDGSETKIEQKRHFISLIKMALFPLLPNLIKKSDFGSKWSLDLREVSDE